MAIKTGNPQSKRRGARSVQAGASRALELPPAGVSVRSVRHEAGPDAGALCPPRPAARCGLWPIGKAERGPPAPGASG